MSTRVRPGSDACAPEFLPWFGRRPGPGFVLFWLPVLLVAPIVMAVRAADVGQVLVLLLLAALYGATALVRYRTRVPRRAEILVVASVLVVIAYQFWWNDHQVFLYPLLALQLATGIRRRWAMGFIGGLAISGAVAAGITDGLSEALVFGFATYLAGISAFLIDFLIETIAQLRTTRERLATAAVAEERERFSRDLHDLLGHTLSVIVIKAEAVRRFVGTNPTAAADHARGIEEIGRSALAEVRQAVVGYREATLADELEATRRTLVDAGLRVELDADEGRLPPAVDRLFAWVVREGATNILRHARAKSCTILVESGGGQATIEVTDDGGSPASGHGPARAGSGLSGLRERAERLGGVLAADHLPTGFRLGVSVPTGEAEEAR